MLIRLSTPSGLAVPLDEMKAGLRILGSAEDARLQRLTRAETRRYEDYTGRIMLPTSLEYRLNRWRNPICLPAAPVREVTEVVYLDANHVEQTLASSAWYEVITPSGAEIWFTDGFSAPTLSDRQQAVRVRFAAGYDEEGTTGADDPELAPVEIDQINIIRLVQAVFDDDEAMKDEDIIRTMGHRRVFR